MQRSNYSNFKTFYNIIKQLLILRFIMTRSSIIIFGILAAILLIFSCITLNAPKFYNELETTSSPQLLLKPQLVLRDRN
jgi:hypothetical protein